MAFSISYCRRPPYLAVEVDDLHRSHTRHIIAHTKILSNAGLRLLHDFEDSDLRAE